MATKVIAIGNVIMGDDGIGIRVLEKIQSQLEEMGMECFIGETDPDYCVSRVNEEDFIFVIDAAYCGKNVGDITIASIEEFKLSKFDFSQHGISLLNMSALGFKAIKGYIIGIEIKSIAFSELLTEEILDKIDDICTNVKSNIENLVKMQ